LQNIVNRGVFVICLDAEQVAIHDTQFREKLRQLQKLEYAVVQNQLPPGIVCPSVHRSIHPSIHSSIHPYPSIHPSMHPPTHSFIHSFIIQVTKDAIRASLVKGMVNLLLNLRRRTLEQTEPQ
jgi:hypothetical protein